MIDFTKDELDQILLAVGCTMIEMDDHPTQEMRNVLQRGVEWVKTQPRPDVRVPDQDVRLNYTRKLNVSLLNKVLDELEKMP